MEEAVEEGTVFEKERPEILIDSEDTMPVSAIDEFERHTGSTFHGVFISAGRAETAVTTKGNKF